MSKSSKVTLYKNHLNNIGTWSIWFEDNVIHIEHAQTEGGAPIRHTEEVPEGKQSRTLKQQVIHRIKSRINKQLDRGYVKNREDALVPPTNSLNLQQPMLALAYKRAGVIDNESAYWQLKLDGHRCLVTKVDGEVLAYSRQGKYITTISHILDDLENIPEGIVLDGELYHHGTKLQTIGSWAKRLQPDTVKLTYHVYDIVKGVQFSERLKILVDIFDDIDSSSVVLHDTYKVDENFQALNQLLIAREAGYEGIMIRHTIRGYETGRRSRSLVKVKAFEDTEVEVIGAHPSKEGWAVLECKTQDGKFVDASAPGTKEEKFKVMISIDKYIGRFVTIEFANYTDDGIPFQPVATRWREDL